MFVLAVLFYWCVVVQGTPFTLSGQYAVVTTVQLGEAAVTDAALQLHSTLDVTLVNDDEQNLFNFQLSAVETHGRGAGRSADFTRRASTPGGTFAARLVAGRLAELLLEPGAPPHVRDYQRALASLFQFQAAGGEFNETDVSGDCAVLYERLGDRVLRKIKSQCRWDGSGGAEATHLACRRVTRVSLSETGALDSLHADEVCATTAGWAGGLRARSLHALRRLATPTAAPRPDPALRPARVPLPPPTDPDDPADPALHDDRNLEVIAEEWLNSLPLEDPELSLKLYYAMRRASADDIATLLTGALGGRADAALWRAAGVAACQPAHVAARPALSADRAPALALPYLQGLALAPQPQEEVVLDVLSLSGGLPAELRAAARLAAAAGAARVPGGGARAAVFAALARALPACADDACRLEALLALHNLRAAPPAPDLLALAETAGERAAAAALALLEPARLGPLAGRVARLAGTRSRPLGARAAALLLCVEAAAAPPTNWLELARLLRALEAGELRRVLWGALAARGLDAPLRAMLPPELRSWHALATPGTSSVLRREAWRALDAALWSRQLATRGVLRAGTVTLTHGARPHHVLGVHVWTRGLEAWTGGGGAGEATDAEDAGDEEAAAGLQLSVAGTNLPPITLFSSQAELLSLVWGGAGSEPTPVLRGALLLPPARLAPGAPPAAPLAPLAAGLLLRYAEHRAAAFTLDGQATVSLWGRTARAALWLRGALWARGALRVTSPWAALAAAAHVVARPALSIAADLDFYDGVALCVRAATEPYALDANLTTVATVRRASTRSVRRQRPRPPRTLALGRPNDQLCRQ